MRFTVNPTSITRNTNVMTSSQANDVASLLLDRPNSVGRDVPITAKAFRGNELFTYAADRWQVFRKLTLDLGLRWEFYPPFTPSGPGRFSNYDPTTNNLVIAALAANPPTLGKTPHYTNFPPPTGTPY